MKGICVKFYSSTFGVLRRTSNNLCHSNLYVMCRQQSTNSIRIPDLMKVKLQDFVTWYEEMTGMDEVRFAQNRVLQAEERFKSAQERRREATVALSEIQNKLRDLYAELDTTRRGEERYVYLITQEQKLLKEDRSIQDKFKDTEKEERDYFAAFSSSVKESHEKERAQADRTKYWSIIGSIIGTVIGIVGTTINNQFKMKELRKLVYETNNSEQWNTITKGVTNNEEKLINILDIIKQSDNAVDKEPGQYLSEIQQDLHVKLQKIVDELDFRVKHLDSNKNNNEVPILSVTNKTDDVISDKRLLSRNMMLAAATGVMITLFVENLSWW